MSTTLKDIVYCGGDAIYGRKVTSLIQFIVLSASIWVSFPATSLVAQKLLGFGRKWPEDFYISGNIRDKY
jgi:hypothetical protein